MSMHRSTGATTRVSSRMRNAASGSFASSGSIARARRIQLERYADHDGVRPVRVIAEAEGELLERAAPPDAPGGALLVEAAERMRLTARGYHRVLKVARTIADLDGARDIGRIHIAEALGYRRIAPGR